MLLPEGFCPRITHLTKTNWLIFFFKYLGTQTYFNVFFIYYEKQTIDNNISSLFKNEFIAFFKGLKHIGR